MHTNLHTHGLKVDAGAINKDDLDPCQKSQPADTCVDPSPGQECQVFIDNIFASTLPGGGRTTYTYTLPPSMPGMAWVSLHASWLELRESTPPTTLCKCFNMSSLWFV